MTTVRQLLVIDGAVRRTSTIWFRVWFSSTARM